MMDPFGSTRVYELDPVKQALKVDSYIKDPEFPTTAHLQF